VVPFYQMCLVHNSSKTEAPFHVSSKKRQNNILFILQISIVFVIEQLCCSFCIISYENFHNFAFIHSYFNKNNKSDMTTLFVPWEMSKQKISIFSSKEQNNSSDTQLLHNILLHFRTISFDKLQRKILRDEKIYEINLLTFNFLFSVFNVWMT